MAPPDTIWHKESLKLKEIFGTREGFEICPYQLFPAPIKAPFGRNTCTLGCKPLECRKLRIGTQSGNMALFPKLERQRTGWIVMIATFQDTWFSGPNQRPMATCSGI